MSGPESRHRSSLLRAAGGGFGRGILPSLGLHTLLLALWVLPGLWGISLPGCNSASPPLIDQDIFMVTAVVLPKATSLPTKAAAPKPPEAGETGQKEAPPIVEDQVVLKTPVAEKKKGTKTKPKEKPKEKPKKKSRKDLLASVEEDADELIFETSVEGDPAAKRDRALLARFGRPLSAYERQVHDQIKENWFPKFTSSSPDPDVWAAMTFTLGDDGTIRSPSVERSSKDRVFDMSCLRSISRTRRVPPPPADAPRVFHIRFSPEDKS
ncbi:MAG: TonB family protein [Myxococcota bacterium]|nr:TonB family protein [Myxococcota bacterium]